MKLRVFLASCVIALAGCATQPGTTPAQNAVNLTSTSCKNIDAAIVGTDAAVLSGALKGNAAKEALKGLTAMQAGCVAALASIQSATAAANPASGVSK